MKKSIKEQVVTHEALAQLRLPLADLMRSTLLDTVITMGSMEAVRMLEEQREAICGPRHAHGKDRKAYRHGSCSGALVMGGRRVTVPCPGSVPWMAAIWNCLPGRSARMRIRSRSGPWLGCSCGKSHPREVVNRVLALAQKPPDAAQAVP